MCYHNVTLKCENQQVMSAEVHLQKCRHKLFIRALFLCKLGVLNYKTIMAKINCVNHALCRIETTAQYLSEMDCLELRPRVSISDKYSAQVSILYVVSLGHTTTMARRSNYCATELLEHNVIFSRNINTFFTISIVLVIYFL